MAVYNVKTTTTVLLLCSDPDPVDGKTSGSGTASLHELFLRTFSKESLFFSEVYFSIQKAASGWLNG